VIDWKLLIDGEIPNGWDRHKDGCFFPDFDIQSFLLPHFDVGSQPIDEYGRTAFEQDDLRRLRTHLEWQRGFLEAKPDSWKITESSGDRSYSREIRRDAALQVIDKTLNMIERALKINGTIVFLGD
jgi:hypothetical protein